MPTSFRTTRRSRARTGVPEQRRGPTDAAESTPPDDVDEVQDADEPTEEHWADDGDSWWAPHPVPPSYRDQT